MRQLFLYGVWGIAPCKKMALPPLPSFAPFFWQSSPNYDILCYRKSRSFSASAQISYYIIYPNGRNAESVNPSRGADSQIARKQMLAQFMLAKPAFYPSCAHRTRFLPALSHYDSNGVWGEAAPE